VPETQAQSPPLARRRERLFLAAQLAAFALGLALTIPTELERWRIAKLDRAGVVAWFFEFSLDTTLPFLLLVVAPFCWLVRRRPALSDDAGDNAGQAHSQPLPTRTTGTDWAAWSMALVCAATSLVASAWVASHEVGQGALRSRFGDLPPAYHDEFSYLLQAKTFLAGRLSYPSHPRMPELFDQMHVVNEGRFASRYFPGVGAWIAPFLELGHPYWAQWLGGALAAVFTFWAGRELAGNRLGLFAGVLTALSPGIALFDNLLLSHAPTLAALMLFLFAFLRFMRTSRASDAFWAGCGLSFAMLCRPMTAAGFGMPFGIWLVAELGRRLSHRVRSGGIERPTPSPPAPLPRGGEGGGVPVSAPLAKDCVAPKFSHLSPRGRGAGGEGPFQHGPTLWKACLWLASPIVLGLVLLFFYNRAITGNGLVTPYQLYTDTYTPRHVYGFNNVARGQQRAGPRVMQSYDEWAKNLTPQLALENEKERLEASARWTLGLVPVAMAGVIFLIAVFWSAETRWKLVALSIVSLHAVHVPYWFVGIMGLHYVFESAPLLLLIICLTTRELVACWRSTGRLVMPVWWGALIAAAVLTNWVTFDPFWSTSRIESGIDEVAFSRLKYEAFQEVIDRGIKPRPLLVLIKGDPDDRSIDYVDNDPDLSGPVLRGRYREGQTRLARIRAAFPDRAIYFYDVKQNALGDVTHAIDRPQ